MIDDNFKNNINISSSDKYSISITVFFQPVMPKEIMTGYCIFTNFTVYDLSQTFFLITGKENYKKIDITENKEKKKMVNVKQNHTQ